MACFIVPAAEAIVTTTVSKVLKTKEDAASTDFDVKSTASYHVQKLSNLLWGGSALLAFEHVWHGEIMPAFPFLAGTDILHEMSTTGVAMAVVVTAFWGALTLIETKVSGKREARQ